MNPITKLAFISVVFLLVIFTFGSCSDGSGDGDSHALEGDWTLTTSPTGGSQSIGSGNFSQTYIGNMELLSYTVDLYSGSGSLSGGDIDGSYSVGGSEYSGQVIFSFSDGSDQDNDGETDTLDFDGTLSGDTVTGTYAGYSGNDSTGKFASYEGTFTATKQ